MSTRFIDMTFVISDGGAVGMSCVIIRKKSHPTQPQQLYHFQDFRPKCMPAQQKSVYFIVSYRGGGGSGWGVRSTVVARWTAGQQVDRAILHQGHDSQQNSYHQPRLSPAPKHYSFYCSTIIRRDKGLATNPFHLQLDYSVCTLTTCNCKFIVKKLPSNLFLLNRSYFDHIIHRAS